MVTISSLGGDRDDHASSEETMNDLYLGGTLEGEEIRSKFELDSSRLRTHAVVVGMTGSGKTGLVLVMLEELARAGVPVIAIDPKGDLGNLGLLFPQLRAEDFAPWVEGDNPQEVADDWRDGLQRWGLGGDELAALDSQLDLQVYTPGSRAGQPINILDSFRLPAGGAGNDADARAMLVSACTTGLLGLVGHGGDPIRDPAHIVLSQILNDSWAAGEDPGVEELILRLVDPPFAKVGVFPLDRFFPPDDRMDLAMALNGVLAAPSFAAWTEGAALDIEAMLAKPEDNGGRTKVSVVTLAHLSDAQRSFMLALLLGQLRAWTRAQPGADRLRAVLFFDEAAGYLPPHPANPPTKTPLLTMMKQARAVGLGVVLATQNPVDLDYKALSNAGIWAIGRLQTPQDRHRLLEGLNRPDLDELVGNLGKRRFLVQDAKEDQPVVLQSRHAMCYLRGPFTNTEIAKLKRSDQPPPPSFAAPRAPLAQASTFKEGAPEEPAAAEPDDGLLPAPPPMPGDGWFLDPRVVFGARLAPVFGDAAEPPRADGKLHWKPAVYADLELRFDEDRAGFVLDHRLRRVWFPLDQSAPPQPIAVEIEEQDLLERPDEPGRFHSLPAWLDEKSEITAMRKEVLDDVYRTETRGMFRQQTLKLYGKPRESRESFEERCHELIERRIDKDLAKLHDRFATKADRLQARLDAKRAKLVEYEGVVRSRKTEEVVNIGETVFSFFAGRRRSITSVVSRRRQTRTAGDRVERTRMEIEDLEEQASELQQQLNDDVSDARSKHEELLEDIVEKEVRLEKKDIRILSFGVLWVPVTRRI